MCSGASRAGTTESGKRELKGEVTFEQIVNASKTTISADKINTIVSSLGGSEVNRVFKKRELETVLNSNGINDVVINFYRDKSGANALRRMQDAGFEVQAHYSREVEQGSQIPPRDYYYMKRKTNR